MAENKTLSQELTKGISVALAKEDDRFTVLWLSFLSFRLISLEVLSCSPESFHRILRNDPVVCDEDKLFLLGLGNKKSVEWIAMNIRQTLYALKMRGENRQMAKTSLAAKTVVFGYGDVAVQSSKTLFDCDLP